MRCLACNAGLNDVESTRKTVSTGEYVDLCNICFGTISDGIPVIETDFGEEPDDFDEPINFDFQDDEDYGDKT